MNVRAKRLLPAVAASVLLLTGCGVQGLQWHPGIAATVGDQTITDQRIDELTTGYCTALKPQLTSSGEIAPLGVLRSAIVRGLVTKSAVTQVGEDYGVGAGDTYRRALAQTTSSAATLPAGAKDAYIELQTLNAYISSVAQSIGGKIAFERGESGATLDQKIAAGQKAVSSWIERNTVEVSPAYDTEIKNGQAVVADADVSYAGSSTAKAAFGWQTSQSPDKQYAASLPSSQACG